MNRFDKLRKAIEDKNSKIFDDIPNTYLAKSLQIGQWREALGINGRNSHSIIMELAGIQFDGNTVNHDYFNTFSEILRHIPSEIINILPPLLKKNYNPNAKDINGHTSLHHAVKKKILKP